MTNRAKWQLFMFAVGLWNVTYGVMKILKGVPDSGLWINFICGPWLLWSGSPPVLAWLNKEEKKS